MDKNNSRNTNDEWEQFATGFSASAEMHDQVAKANKELAGSYRSLEAIAKKMKSTIDLNTQSNVALKKEMEQLREEHKQALNRIDDAIDRIALIAENAASETTKTTQEQWRKSLSALDMTIGEAIEEIKNEKEEITNQIETSRKRLSFVYGAFTLVLVFAFVFAAIGAWWLITATPAIQEFFAGTGWIVLLILLIVILGIGIAIKNK